MKLTRLIFSFFACTAFAIATGHASANDTNDHDQFLVSSINEQVGIERAQATVLKLASRDGIFCKLIPTFHISEKPDGLDVFDSEVFPNISRHLGVDDPSYGMYARANALAVCSKFVSVRLGMPVPVEKRIQMDANLLFDESQKLLLIENRLRKD